MKKFLFLLLLTIPPSTSAAGIEVSPSRLELNTDSKTRAELQTSNPTPDVQIFEVYTEEFEDLIEINPRSFTLESAESKKIEVIVNPKNKSEAVLQTEISIVSRPLADSEFSAATGVKIPLIIRIEKTTNKNFVWKNEYALLILVGLLLARIIMLLRNKKPPAYR